VPTEFPQQEFDFFGCHLKSRFQITVDRLSRSPEGDWTPGDEREDGVTASCVEDQCAVVSRQPTQAEEDSFGREVLDGGFDSRLMVE
jgi:hypothetical protein